MFTISKKNMNIMYCMNNSPYVGEVISIAALIDRDSNGRESFEAIF